jgi:hypothetical protein
MSGSDERYVTFVRLVCVLMILNEMQRKTITMDYDKLSFKNIFN